mmetsp:Transcript_8782/g.19959  ORF Transcript_8782/g.19959 Transcript_8782/m.19959 type:complete len:98 (-) Transcript_8782:485-778(-)
MLEQLARSQSSPSLPGEARAPPPPLDSTSAQDAKKLFLTVCTNFRTSRMAGSKRAKSNLSSSMSFVNSMLPWLTILSGRARRCRILLQLQVDKLVLL